MASRSNRRQFMQTTAALGVGYWVAGGLQAQESNSPNERVAIAATGYGLVGPWNFADSNKFGKLVAVCEVDENRLSAQPRPSQGQAIYRLLQDARRDGQEHRRGGHRRTRPQPHRDGGEGDEDGQALLLPEAADADDLGGPADGRRRPPEKVCTQMGNQGTSFPTLRHAAALLRAKVVGKVSEVHVWTDRPNWPFKQGQKLPPAGPVPPTFDWDLWIGPAPMRPFIPGSTTPCPGADSGTSARGPSATWPATR